jgi:hypothetical protein
MAAQQDHMSEAKSVADDGSAPAAPPATCSSTSSCRGHAAVYGVTTPYRTKINAPFKPERSSLCVWVGCRVPLVNWTTRAPQILWPEALSDDYY